jgi:hypothetical protein
MSSKFVTFRERKTLYLIRVRLDAITAFLPFEDAEGNRTDHTLMLFGGGSHVELEDSPEEIEKCLTGK